MMRRGRSSQEPGQLHPVDQDATVETHPSMDAVAWYLNLLRCFHTARKYSFFFIKTWSVSVPASSTRHRLDCPSRIPGLRRHSDSGAKSSVLISVVLRGSSEDTPVACSPSFGCEEQSLECNMRLLSGTYRLRQRVGK